MNRAESMQGQGTYAHVRPKKVIAACDIDKITLAPVSTSIGYAKVDGESAANQLCYLGVLMQHKGTAYHFWISACSIFAKDGVAADKAKWFVEPFWLVQETTDPAEANMEINQDRLEDESSKEPFTIVVKLPTMVNTRPIKCGEELMILKKKKDKDGKGGPAQDPATGDESAAVKGPKGAGKVPKGGKGDKGVGKNGKGKDKSTKGAKDNSAKGRGASGEPTKLTKKQKTQ